MVLYRQDQLSAARKAFETVTTLLPDHAPSLNNIAVIQWRQNQPMTALNFFDRALLAAPNRRDVLDNVAEALNALPVEDREAPVTKKLVRHFNEQDAAMQAAMQKQGLFRWGATWVSAAELEKLQEAEKQIKDKLDKLSASFDAVTARIARIDADIQTDTIMAKRMESDSFGHDPSTGGPGALPAAGQLLRHGPRRQDAPRPSGRPGWREQERMRPAGQADPAGAAVAEVHGDAAGDRRRRRPGLGGGPRRGRGRRSPTPITAPPAAPAAPALTAPAGPVVPPAPAPAPSPATSPVLVAPPPPPGSPGPANPATQPASRPVSSATSLPRHTIVPPEKPSIMDRDPYH